MVFVGMKHESSRAMLTRGVLQEILTSGATGLARATPLVGVYANYLDNSGLPALEV
jgi:hypothetical protein